MVMVNPDRRSLKKGKKYGARWVGPYKVVDVVTPGQAYRLQLPMGSRAHPVFNATYLKPYHAADEDDDHSTKRSLQQKKMKTRLNENTPTADKN